MVDSFYGLGETIKRALFKHKGIPDLYEWQKDCLNQHEFNVDKNLIYSVPTSGGKTLVAEILMLKELFVKNRNAIFIVPFVSIVQEKVSSLSALALDLGFWVEEYAGSKGVYPPTKHRKKHSLYVCTIEKGMGLLNSLIEENRISEVGIVVIDEVHLIGEPRRGATLENICIKMKKSRVKLIGLSATVGNIRDLTKFLDATLYTHDFRPGSLKEFVKIDNEVFLVNHGSEELIEFHYTVGDEINKLVRTIDPDGIGALVQEVIPEKSCLVFCQSKKNCENVAQLIVKTINLKNLRNRFIEYKERERIALLKAISLENNDVMCPILERTIPYGIVFHHSGITVSERKLIEEAYAVGTISCICCTSTLAAGVNLPAERVILRAPYVGAQFMSKSTYKQMIGRAGRAGLAEKGESYLICNPQQAPLVRELMEKPMDCCSSQLIGEDLKTFILSCFFLDIVKDYSSLQEILHTSFLQLCTSTQEMEKMVSQAVETLLMSQVLRESGSLLTLTPFGKAIAKANISCEDGKHLMKELMDAQKKLVLIGDLHLLYLVTPHSMAANLKPVHEVIASTYANLRQKELYVASCLGISEFVIARIMMGKPPPKSTPQRVLEKFYLCLMVYQLWKGHSAHSVANAYKVDRGSVHNLLLQTTSYASSVIRFCEAIEPFWPFVKLLSIFPDKLNYCCSADLLPLMELPAVKIGRAKQLHKAGFKTVLSIAKADPKSLTNEILHLPLKIATQIVNVAKLKMQTKYETLQEEAEEYKLQGTTEHTLRVNLGTGDNNHTNELLDQTQMLSQSFLETLP